MVFSVYDRFGKHRHNSSAVRKRDSGKRTMGVGLTDSISAEKKSSARTYTPKNSSARTYTPPAGLEELDIGRENLAPRHFRSTSYGPGRLARQREPAEGPFFLRPRLEPSEGGVHLGGRVSPGTGRKTRHLVAVNIDFVQRLEAWGKDAYVADKNIPQLRQLSETRILKELAKERHSRTLRCATINPRTEPELFKGPPSLTHTLQLQKDRTSLCPENC